MRGFKMQVWAVLVLSRFVVAADSASIAEKEYALALEKAKAAYDQKVDEAKTKYYAALEVEKAAAMKANNLDMAVQIKAKQDALKPGGSTAGAPNVAPPAYEGFLGTYTVTNNGSRNYSYEITFNEGGFYLNENGRPPAKATLINGVLCFDQEDGLGSAVSVEFNPNTRVYTFTQWNGIAKKGLGGIKALGGPTWYRLPGLKIK